MRLVAARCHLPPPLRPSIDHLRPTSPSSQCAFYGHDSREGGAGPTMMEENMQRGQTEPRGEVRDPRAAADYIKYSRHTQRLSNHHPHLPARRHCFRREWIAVAPK
ncbi:hypothetical protein E2C01_074863 [Portunus trituberculatus]|uniref:Uncharacterized protein n=1 Tax=Portunus trituberculatus TaxID=210409 RepID=A0A5B7IFD9_PORTR|nr:hypothetical protein [Portunus trituberculatus]